jgi:hypothetical protein
MVCRAEDRRVVLITAQQIGIGAVMKLIFAIILLSGMALTSAVAQDTCESKAVSKDGKLLAGAAKASFLKKCKADTCAARAISHDGKQLSGAAKNSFMKKCQKEA